MGFQAQGNVITQSQQAGSTQSFTNFGTQVGANGLFSNAGATTAGSPGWYDINVGWYVYGTGITNGVITAINNSAGTVTVGAGAFVPGAIYVFKSTPYPINT
jgi:hypothetical protein